MEICSKKNNRKLAFLAISQYGQYDLEKTTTFSCEIASLINFSGELAIFVVLVKLL